MPPSPLPPKLPTPIGFGATCLRAMLYILLITGLMQGIYYEALYLQDVRFSEYGFTELAQIVFLCIISALLLYIRHVLKALPTVTLLMFAFVFSSLVRELDYFFDTYVFDGAWQVIVTLVILPSLFMVIRKRHAFLAEFERYANSFSFGLFASGFLVTYVFSRFFGRSELWIAILNENYARTFKDIVEEVTELLGYSLILIAVIELIMLARRWRA
ncbi:hypothetical protein L861_16255 [Litchfieldella anticariensis FP35 = DSM 16096]|uniref:Uncharacterized protein n=1 Tax=Litchfieldella anticariensis (strain DSM 16096 / CECT 5854 / CIP 108499 / LMG 22089 / FP35) TaxID=1121939 RepID=S2LBZ5_LITA3|nr:hypothetical protein [Halomonas anticariensis]EPC02261.1 hypothetical protein L861_16255 [Halomonas anticariensis FP35 = DSM 16096]